MTRVELAIELAKSPISVAVYDSAVRTNEPFIEWARRICDMADVLATELERRQEEAKS